MTLFKFKAEKKVTDYNKRQDTTSKKTYINTLTGLFDYLGGTLINIKIEWGNGNLFLSKSILIK